MWKLENVIERKQESWESFDLPNKNELLSLKVWSIVKLIFIYDEWENERMWVEITNILVDWKLEGNLVNSPNNIPNLEYGDKITFWYNNIIDIYKNA